MNNVLDFYEKTEPAKMTKDRQITILRKYIEVLQMYLRDSRLSELVAQNELRSIKGLPPISLEIPDNEWIFTGDLE
jgi:integrase